MKIELRPGESVSIGGHAVITLESKSGQVARLSVQADKSVPVHRVQQQSPSQMAAQTGITGKK